MAIIANKTGTTREPIEQGNYVARCYQMIEIGTVKEEFKGEVKELPKVRIGWELPTELKVHDEAKGEQPLVISAEYTVSMGDKANLRKVLESWRGRAFTEDEAKAFDITKLLGVPCMLNIIHKPSKDGSKVYANIASASPLPKIVECPKQINPTFVLSYDNFDVNKYESLPDFIKDKMKATPEYGLAVSNMLHHEGGTSEQPDHIGEADDLPF